MEHLLNMLPNVYAFHFIIICGWIMPSVGSSLNTQNSLYHVNRSTSSVASIDNLTQSKPSDCRVENIGLEDVKFISKKKMYIPTYNINMFWSERKIIVNNDTICFNYSDELKREIFRQCSKWMYGVHEFKLLSNGSALAYNDLMEPGTFELRDGMLLSCRTSVKYNVYNSIDDSGILLYSKHHNPDAVMVIVGNSISVVALTVHLLTFCLIPSLRNFPGYNLASLSLALIIGYSLVVIVQIPEVLGVFCTISGILQLYFLLTVYFCMNVMAFDVWRSLKLATTKFKICSHNKERNHFIIYSIYSWGMPLIITVISVVIDNAEKVPSWIKPHFGRWDVCCLTSSTAKTIFYTIPAVTLLFANVVFCVMSAFIIRNNTMKNVSDEQKQTARLNFFLYVRLGLIMGITWLIGFSDINRVVSLIYKYLLKDFVVRRNKDHVIVESSSNDSDTKIVIEFVIIESCVNF
ncbi:g-protein coupled receptor Mth2 [Nephila pilipes]|uniref:G-protein coupled receptor Mth2 n=1 Tax=Nephila pilipes TaxID=299642 RepID=A0A8X6N420_NEPPI|nr:g-protein coupled receptor Mth2 [Nephila pilipes]